METLAEFTVKNGSVTEVYSVELDAGETFIRASMDDALQADILHIDRSAIRCLIVGLEMALLRTVPVLAQVHPNVVDFLAVRRAAR